jgi:hypothetical protein
MQNIVTGIKASAGWCVNMYVQDLSSESLDSEIMIVIVALIVLECTHLMTESASCTQMRVGAEVLFCL